MKKQISLLSCRKSGMLFLLFLMLIIPFSRGQVNILNGFAGTGSDIAFEDPFGSAITMDHPYGITLDCDGNVYISQQEISTILKVNNAGVMSHVSGTYMVGAGEQWPGAGIWGWPGWPAGITTVIPCGDMCTGTGYAGDGAPCEPGAKYGLPSGLVYDKAYDRLYIADPRNNCIRVIYNPSTGGMLRTFYNPTGSTAMLKIFMPTPEDGAYGPVEPDYPDGCGQVTVGTGMAVDAAGNLYIADNGNNRIIMLPASYIAGPPTVIAGASMVPGYSGDGGAALLATFNNPTGVAIGSGGNIYITDYNNNAVRKIDGLTGVITTIGGGNIIMAFADGPAATSKFAHPINLSVDDAERVYVADLRNNRIRVIYGGQVCTIAGDGTTCTICPYDAMPGSPGINYMQPLGDGANANLGQLFLPSDVKVDKWGNLFIVDMDHNRVRYVCHPQSACTAAPVTAVTITSPGGGSIAWCTPKTFKARAVFAGCNVNYQWQVNGTDVLGAIASTYTYMPVSGDIVTCRIVAQPNPYNAQPYYPPISCPSAMVAMSNPIIVAVEPPPPVTGLTTVCVGSLTTLSETIPGTWTISGGGYASIVSSGLTSVTISGNSVGTETLTFTSTTGCSLYVTITVIGAAPIVGSSTVCEGSTVTLTDIVPGGIWGTFTPWIATIDLAGVVTPVPGGPGGMGIFYYTVTIGDCVHTVYFNVAVASEPHVCVTESCCIPDYMFNFTTTTTSLFPISADYIPIYTYLGGPVVNFPGCITPTIVPNSLPLTPIRTGCSLWVTGVCVKNVYNGGCSWAVDRTLSCCANANIPFNFVGYKHSSHNGSSASGKNIVKELTLSPNPGTGSFNLNGSVDDNSDSKNGTIEIVDMLGKLIYADELTVENGGIDKNVALGKNIPEGIYLIKVRNGDFIKVFKYTLAR